MEDPNQAFLLVLSLTKFLLPMKPEWIESVYYQEGNFCLWSWKIKEIKEVGQNFHPGVSVGDSRDRLWSLHKGVTRMGRKMRDSIPPTHGQHNLAHTQVGFFRVEFRPPYLKRVFAGTVHTGKGHRHSSHSNKLPLFVSHDVEHIWSRTAPLSSSALSTCWRHLRWYLKPRKSRIF